MKRSKVLYIAIGVSLGVLASLPFYSSFFKTSPVDAVSRNQKPNYVSLKDSFQKYL